MKRRRLLSGTVAATALALSAPTRGHTPYGQWVVYRKKHLLIGCHRDDATTYTMAKRTVEHLGEHLPAARSRVARAPNPGRLASLLGTDQLYLAILGYDDAIAMRAGSGSFSPYGQVPVQQLRGMSDTHVLIAHADFPLHHAWLVSEALSDLQRVDSLTLASTEHLPQHPGAELYARGEPNPGSGDSGRNQHHPGAGG